MKYKPYPKYKPSGIDWIGDIPEGWEKERLKYWVNLINEPEESEVEKFLVDLENIESFTGKLLNEIESGGKGMKRFVSGDVLFNKLRPYLAKVFYGGKDGCCGGEFLVLRPKNEIVPKFLFYRVLSIDFINLINNSSYGVKMPRANWDYIGSIFLPYPNQKEQRDIVSYLDNKTAQIDDLIQKKEEMIKLLKEKRAAIINQAVTKGLDPNAKMKPSGIDWIGDIPEGWQKKRIKLVAHINAKTLPENTDDNLAFYYIDIGNVSLEGGFPKGEKILFSEAPSRARRIVQKGDTIISTVRTYLKAIAYIEDDSEELIASTGFAVISPSDEINEKYFYNTLCSERVVQTISAFSAGVSYPAINASEIGNIFIVYPDKQGQEKITDYINKKTAEIDKLIKDVIGAIAKLREYRSSLITAAVTGKIDVRG